MPVADQVKMNPGAGNYFQPLNGNRGKITMGTSEHISLDQQPQQDENDQTSLDQKLVPPPSGNRLFTFLVIAAVFIIIDLAILFYFLWLRTDEKNVEQSPPAVSMLQKEVKDLQSLMSQRVRELTPLKRNGPLPPVW